MYVAQTVKLHSSVRDATEIVNPISLPVRDAAETVKLISSVIDIAETVKPNFSVRDHEQRW